MSADTISLVNFLAHSLVIGAASWLIVRFVVRDALRRCILANLAVLMCLYSPFDISLRDLFPPQKPVPVWTPLRETFEQDWRVTVAPEPRTVVTPLETKATAPPVRNWDVNDAVIWLRRLSWGVTALLLLSLFLQSLRVQRWAWRLRHPSAAEYDKLPQDIDPKRIRVFDHEGTPCAAAWFFPVIAVPASAFASLTPRRWRWLLRHESEHLRCHDTVVVLLQNIVRAFLWWNPFVHALIEAYARAREEACDAAAVGGETDHEDYAGFLLAWTAKAAPQPACVMPIARSRPARRLQARLEALMEARGVRKKLGALFVLACVAFAVIVPLFAASFGITTAAAQEAPKVTSDDDGRMRQRIYGVGPDFLKALSSPQPPVDPFSGDAPDPFSGDAPSGDPPPLRISVWTFLKEQGVPFPEGTTAVFNKATSQLIVRNTVANLALVEKIIDRIETTYPRAQIFSRVCVADKHIGSHGSILSEAEWFSLLGDVKDGLHDVIEMPDTLAYQGTRSSAEVVRQLFGAARISPDHGDIPIREMKLLGPRLLFNLGLPVQGKLSFNVKAKFGLDPEMEKPWSLKEVENAVWDRVRIFSVEEQAALASGDWLVLHLPAPVKPITVVISVQAFLPGGKPAESFAAIPPRPAASTSIEIPNNENNPAMKTFRVPPDFAKDKSPVEMLQEAGVEFPEGASAEMKDGKLTVHNTRANLALVEAWIDSLIAEKRTVRLTVHAAEFRDDFLKTIQELFPPPPDAQKEEPVPPSPVTQKTASEPAAGIQQFAGVFTDSQFQIILRHLTQSGAKPETVPLKSNAGAKQKVFELPAAFGAHSLKVDSEIGSDGYTLDLILQVTGLKSEEHRTISTSITIWDGQTLVLGGPPNEGITRLLFVTGNIVDPSSEE